jgi:hypothetical protein
MATPNPVENPPLAPTQIHSKVGAGAIGGAVAVLVVYGLQHFGHMDPPDTVAVALGTVISFVFGYFAKS